MAINPSSHFFVSTFTATTDAAFRLSDDPNLVLKSCNIHCYSQDAYYGNSMLTPGIIRANAVMWFDAPIRPFDLIFKNLAAGANTTIVITGPLQVKMGYNLSEVNVKNYTPSDDILISNDPVANTASGTYVKLKEIVLSSSIGPSSTFRFNFDMQRLVGGVANGYVTRNDVDISGGGFTNAGGWATFTFDSGSLPWNIGDRVTLWGHGTLGNSMEVRNFRICGIGSEWVNTL